MKSISDLIEEWYVEYSRPHSSGKGTAMTIPIKGMGETITILFHSIKELGYEEKDVTDRVKEQIRNCCMPATLKGKDKSGWVWNVNVCITKARIAVFGTSIKEASPEEAKVYAEKYEAAVVPKNEKANDTIVESDVQEPDGEDDYFVSPNFKPLNRSNLKETIPDIVEDDSWIHEMADSFDE